MLDNRIKQKILLKAKQRGFTNFNIDTPITWCEKMQWLQLNDNIELRAKCADKILVHDYCKDKLGKDICVPIIKIYNSENEIDFDKLPQRFVLKCNHGYAFNIICRNKNQLDKTEVCRKIKIWLNTPFGESSLEPHYLKIKRKCYSEKFIENTGQLEVTDYKFVCFNGTPTYCQILNGRHTLDFHLNYYDMDFNFVNISRTDVKNNPGKIDKKPQKFELMKKYAEILSKDFRFVRVDFYEVDGTVYLGEMTFTPATGFIKWTEPSIDKKFGDLIKL